MGKLHDVQHFADGLSQVRSPNDLERALTDVARQMGFDVVTMFQHVDLSRITPDHRHMQSGGFIGITNASVNWSEHYRDHDFISVDPRVLACERTVSPFATADVGHLVNMGAAQRDVVDSRRRADIGEGFTMPIHFPGEPSGSCTFSAKCGRAVRSDNFAMAHWVGLLAYESARRLLVASRRQRTQRDVRPLTQRQLQCTVLVGRGLGECEIARRLGISPETVKRHLKDARLSYGVGKSVQLVTHALQDAQITLRDIFAERRADR